MSSVGIRHLVRVGARVGPVESLGRGLGFWVCNCLLICGSGCAWLGQN